MKLYGRVCIILGGTMREVQHIFIMVQVRLSVDSGGDGWKGYT